MVAWWLGAHCLVMDATLDNLLLQSVVVFPVCSWFSTPLYA